MFVVRLPNGNLLAPESAVDREGQVMGDAYVEISPADPQYARLARQAVSEEELDLRRQFLDFLARRGNQGWTPPGRS